MKALVRLLTLLAFASPAFAAHSFHVEDMQKLSRVAGPKVSPNGKWVAFTVTRSDVAKNKTVTNIWMVSATGDNPRQMTFADQGSNNNLRWSPDGRSLYFLSTRIDNKAQIFRLPVAGGEAEQITKVPTGVDDYVLSPDGKTIAIEAKVFPSCTDMACNEKMAKERADNPVKVRVITEMPFRRWDTWVDGLRNHIFVMPADGGTAKDLTPGDVDSPTWQEEGSQEVAFSPDSREICFSRYVENEALTGNSDLFVMPVNGGTPKPITTNKSTDRTPLYSPDGRYIAYSATLRPMQETDLVRLFLYDRKTGEHKNIFEAADRSVDSYIWSPGSSALYVTFEDKGVEPLERLDIDTMKLTPLVTSGSSGDADISKDGAFLVFSKTDFSHPADLFRLNLPAAAGAAPSQLTQMNADILKDIEWGEASSFTFPGWNSETVQAWAIKPPEFDANEEISVAAADARRTGKRVGQSFSLSLEPAIICRGWLRGDHAEFSRLIGLRPEIHGRDQRAMGRSAVRRSNESGGYCAHLAVCGCHANCSGGRELRRLHGELGGGAHGPLPDHRLPRWSVRPYDHAVFVRSCGRLDAGVQRHTVGKPAGFDRAGARHIREEFQNTHVDCSWWPRLSRPSEPGIRDVSGASGAARSVEADLFRGRKSLGAQAREQHSVVPHRLGLAGSMGEARPRGV